MKISSRPDEEDVTIIGSGPMQLMLTPEQLELIAALSYSIRLGTGSVYKRAAFELLETLEQEFGSDFLDACSQDVNLQVTIEDDTTGMMVVSTLNNPDFSLSLEV